MLRERPFGSDTELFDAAERIWWSLSPPDWLEAFAQHPRIGEPEGADPRTARWSGQEQSGAASASPEIRTALARANRQYETRFGYRFIVCATGLSAEELLRRLEQRLGNDPARELLLAAAEQAKITRLRLRKLVEP